MRNNPLAGKTVLILGATSTIARATAHVFAKHECNLYLAARDLDELTRISADIHVRYRVIVEHGLFDVTEFDAHANFLDQVIQRMHQLDGVVLATGALGNHELALSDTQHARLITDTNYTGPMSILNHCANYFKQSGDGFIVGITSVAGDRGRQSNFYYGAAKGGFALHLQGLRNYLFPLGVHVLTVKPGFVDTGMTYGMPGLFLVANPTYIGHCIVNAVSARKDVIYTPWFWRYIMLIIRLIPEKLFKRLKL